MSHCPSVHLVTQTGAAIELESPDVILGVLVVFPDLEKYHTVCRGNLSPQQKTFETGIKCHTVHLVTQTGAAIELESPDVILGVYVVFPDAQWPVAHDTKNNTK